MTHAQIDLRPHDVDHRGDVLAGEVVDPGDRPVGVAPEALAGRRIVDERHDEVQQVRHRCRTY